ncbi:MAG: hypothetical protein M3450_06535 [Actinomycetota bacterium]|nr:hypothetical protein [Actinomycetota bacterium]
MSRRLSVLCISALALFSACGGSQVDGNAEQTSSAKSEGSNDAVATNLGRDREARAVSRRCSWSVGKGREISESRIRQTFFDATGGTPVGLLLESPTVRPGQQFQVSIWNRADGEVFHGVRNHIERTDGDQLVTLENQYAPAIGLVVRSGEAGPCVTVSVPSDAEVGSYRVVLDDVQGMGEVSGNFEVAGEPIQMAGWERHLDALADEERSQP